MWFTIKSTIKQAFDGRSFENESKLLQIQQQLHTDRSLSDLCVYLLWYAPLDLWKVRLEIKEDMDLSLQKISLV